MLQNIIRAKHRHSRVQAEKPSQQNGKRCFEPLEDRHMLSGSPLNFDLSPEIWAEIHQAALIDFHGPDLSGKDGPLSNLGFDLTFLFNEFQFHETHSNGPFTAFNGLIRTIDDQVGVRIVAENDLEDIQAPVNGLGLQNHVIGGAVLAGLLPIESLDELAALDEVRFARPIYEPVTHVGLVDSEGDSAMKSDQVRDTVGVDGTGITVGVLSNSFDNLGGAVGDIASGDLPPEGVNVLLDDPEIEDGIDEGRAMLQIVHDVAPGAALAFHTASGGAEVLAAGILELAAAGSGVIIDDVNYSDQPFFQDGVIAQAVDTVVASGIPYFSAAGNNGVNSYQADFIDSGIPGASGGTLHDFDPDVAIDAFQQVTVPVGAVVATTFQWDEPFASVGGTGSASDLDFLIFGADETTLVNAEIVVGGTDGNIGADAVELVLFENDGSIDVDGIPGPDEVFNFAFELVNGPAPNVVKYIDFSQGMLTVEEFDTQSSTIFGHPNAVGAASIAASGFFNTADRRPLLNDFSSAGPTPIFFDTAGNRLAEPEIRQRPNLTGPDFVSTTVPGFEIFAGTSAAAPHAGAVAALILDAAGGAGSLSPDKIYTAMQETAIDILERVSVDDGTTVPILDGAGVDFFSGFGFIDALAAVNWAPPVVGTVFHDVNGDGMRDPTESGVSGVLVFIDEDNNGIASVVDFGGVSDDLGIYQIPGAPSTGILRAAIPPGTIATTPLAVDLFTVTDPVDFGIQASFDFGDAPNDGGSFLYPTTLAQDGARHLRVNNLFLGARIDSIIDGLPNVTATGDDAAGVADDEDGTFLASAWTAGAAGTLRVVGGIAAPQGLFNYWVDWNRDGDWDDAEEKVFANQALAFGENLLNFTVPAGAIPGLTYTRARLGIEQNLDVTGESGGGEVEDELILVQTLDSAEIADVIGIVDVTETRQTLGPQLYKFTAGDDGPFTIDATFSHDQGDINLYLFDGNGSLIATSTTTTNNEEISFEASGHADYFLQVVGTNAALVDVDFNGPEAVPLPVPLGAVDFVLLSGQSVSDGSEFLVEAMNTGTLTLQVDFSSALGSVDTVIYDLLDNVLANGAANGNQARVDIDAVQGQTYRLAIVGSHPDVDVRIVNQVRVGGNINVFGTEQDDSFQFKVNGDLQIAANGVSYDIVDDGWTRVLYDGGGGQDSITLTGGPLEELAVVEGDSVVLRSDNYAITGESLETIRVFNGGGEGRGILKDTASNDTVIARPTHTMTRNDTTVARLFDFDEIRVKSSEGGNDVAKFLGDAVGEELFVGTPDYGLLVGDNYLIKAYEFDKMLVFSNGSTTTDTARLFGSNYEDEFNGTPTDSRISGPGFFTRVFDFGSVTAFATAGGTHDHVTLRSDDPLHTFSATPNSAVLSGSGFTVRAARFSHVHLTADSLGASATVTGSAGSDLYSVTGTFSSLNGTDYWIYTHGISDVTVSGRGGDDTAKFNDIPAVDLIFGRDARASWNSSSFVFHADDFEVVRATARVGETATADVVDVVYAFEQFGSWN